MTQRRVSNEPVELVPEVEYSELSDLNDEILQCKLFYGHEWDKLNDYEINSELARYSDAVLALRCVRCHRERFDYLDVTGNLIGRYYRNPNHYPRTHRLPVVDIRREVMFRGLLVDRLNKKRVSRP